MAENELNHELMQLSKTLNKRVLRLSDLPEKLQTKVWHLPGVPTTRTFVCLFRGVLMDRLSAAALYIVGELSNQGKLLTPAVAIKRLRDDFGNPMFPKVASDRTIMHINRALNKEDGEVEGFTKNELLTELWKLYVSKKKITRILKEKPITYEAELTIDDKLNILDMIANILGMKAPKATGFKVPEGTTGEITFRWGNPRELTPEKTDVVVIEDGNNNGH